MLEVVERKKFVTHAPPRRRPEALRDRSIGEKFSDCISERIKIGRIVDEDPTLAMHDLVLDPTDTTGNDGSVLPHRLRDGEPESFDETLLNDNVRLALHGVDDRGVLPP